MTRDRRLLLLLLGLLTAYDLFFVAECRYHQRGDAATTETRHRHRHKHEPTSFRRSHHELDRRGRQEIEDYEYNADYDSSSVDGYDYDAQSYHDHPRSRHRSAQRVYHSRPYEPRYPFRYHAGGHYGDWYDKDGEDRRGIPSRYNANGHRHGGRIYYRPAYSRNREAPDYDYDDTREDYNKRHGYENGAAEKRWSFRRHNGRDRNEDWNGRDRLSGYRGARKHRLEAVDRDASLWNLDWRRRPNFTEPKYHFSKDDTEAEEDEDYEDHGGLEEDDRDEDEAEVWRDVEDEDSDEEEDTGDDDRSETKAPHMSYDEIIRRLTSNDPTTPRSAVKRDYRNLEISKYARRDGSRNHRPRSLPKTRLMDFFTNASHPATARSGYFANRRVTEENSAVKLAEHKSHMRATSLVKGNDRQEEKSTSKDTRAKTGSLEQDYNEYLNTPNNQKEDDFVKAEVADDSNVQADVTNTDYTDDDNGDESETPADLITSAPAVTTTPKPVVQHKDLRSHGTVAQYNGHQAKNDYPPMSPHSAYKWESLGTSDSVKETRSKMQQWRSKTSYRIKAEDNDRALQHTHKVFKEGMCQWPQAKLINVRETHPNTSLQYYPHCTILHRCSDDTGCCKDDIHTCVTKHSQLIVLTFYTYDSRGENNVIKLKFRNDTECECKQKPELTNDPPKKIIQETREDRQSVFRERHHHFLSPENMKKSSTKKPCRCPSRFMPRIRQNVCQCYCSETDNDCRKIARGKVIISYNDRMCVLENRCGIPQCEFGDYKIFKGACPLKKEVINAVSEQQNAEHNQLQKHRS